MEIAGVHIPPGKNITVDIPIFRLPTNTPIDIIAHVFRSKNEGPTMLVLGGIHGDELNGVEIVKRAEKSKMFHKLQAGTVIAVPLLNVFGFINFSRGLPDGKDVNRSFPGTKSGSLASRVAYALTKEILPHVDFGIDFHTGGKSIYNFPQSRAYSADPASIQLAEEFGMPCFIKGGLLNKSLRKTAHKMGIPMIVFEGGESSRMDEFSVDEALKGIQRVLVARNMVPAKKVASNKPIVIERSIWVRANRSGIFRCIKQSGDFVKKGDILGTISGPFGNFEVKVKAKNDGFIYGHNNLPVISQGDALFHIGIVAVT
ncbi:succinylglutamate desuccinylase/aspartoacylase family protein [Paracrocinitomix mangrovi]|uniref:succinylglutamate desuccinylase/aspartoacylase family protein n=1 Tax=Paracrocinitomix mangrovi TaxID=2862509 RepID=UPI001C8D7F7E|nr:succinylglutamate desuccinylase/aspartoacylase family protein [Paracrocinitomix mangrovi]UKN01106.1 succinylglutamate desuccinylase/aspartoacylase family protein [Paracrocinitomix mangrovi]